MPSSLSRRSFLLLSGGVGAAAASGAGSYALLSDTEPATGSLRGTTDFPEAIRINCGGSTYTTGDGRIFEADDHYTTPSSTYSTPDGIDGTPNDPLYRTERYHDADGFGYRIPVANGTYAVYLHFAEIYFGSDNPGGGGDGSRQFHVDIEGSRVLTNYDIHAQVGQDTAVVESFGPVQVTDGLLSIITTTTTANNPKFSAIEVVPTGSQPPAYQRVDTTGTGATFDVDALKITAPGTDVWTDDDEYGAIYENNVRGDFTAEVTVDSQEPVHEWSKAGIMVANDITAAGSSAGDVFTMVTPGNGYSVQHDADGNGYTDTSTSVGASVYPSRLRVRKRGTTFTSAYSTDGGSTWTRIASVTSADAATIQDVALAVTSHATDTPSRVEFSNVTID